MKKHYVLIDLENVSPSNLSLLNDEKFHIKVFVGNKQSRLPISFVSAMQKFGNRGEYILISGSGKNALDFHITYFLGQLSENEPNAAFHIISKDTGFDPLINFMRSTKKSIQRHSDISQINASKQQSTVPKLENKRSNDEIYNRVYESLEGRGRSRPRKPESLESTIRALFIPPLDQKETKTVLNKLKQKKVTKVNENNVSYSFK